jgi:hypothetical protein
MLFHIIRLFSFLPLMASLLFIKSYAYSSFPCFRSSFPLLALIHPFNTSSKSRFHSHITPSFISQISISNLQAVINILLLSIITTDRRKSSVSCGQSERFQVSTYTEISYDAMPRHAMSYDRITLVHSTVQVSIA